MKCGYCKISTGDYKHGDKERKVFEYLHKRGLPSYLWTVRDQQVGCGSRKRPDVAAQLPVAICTELDCGGARRVLFILEVEVKEHVGNSLQCEIVRVHEISDSTRSAVYLLRYNPDATNALEEEALAALYERVVQVLEEDHLKALEEPCLIVTEYIGYRAGRVERLVATQERLHAEALVCA